MINVLQPWWWWRRRPTKKLRYAEPRSDKDHKESEYECKGKEVSSWVERVLPPALHQVLAVCVREVPCRFGINEPQLPAVFRANPWALRCVFAE